MADYNVREKLDESVTKDNLDSINDFPYVGEQVGEKYRLKTAADSRDFETFYDDPDDDI